MAQWQGQFGGRTNATKVRTLEKTLSAAVTAFKVAAPSDRGSKLKAARNIATRLLSARLHMMRSRISAATEKQEQMRVESLRSREVAARASGIEEILREFGVGSSADGTGELTPATEAEQSVQPDRREDAAPG